MENKQVLGSQTARGGFLNENEICKKFNNWEKDEQAQQWLKIMGYNINLLKSLKAVRIPVRIKKSELNELGICEQDFEEIMKYKKADVQIRLIIKIGNILKIENISLKKANSNANFNQIDKRKVDDYQKMWKFDDQISFWLKLFTGEESPEKHKNLIYEGQLRKSNRIYLDEMPKEVQNKILEFFEKNKILVCNDLIKGRGGLSANWMLVTKYNRENFLFEWVLKDINTVINFFGNGKVEITKKGNLNIGKITMQRKGGTPDPTKLQFKIKPCDLFFLS